MSAEKPYFTLEEALALLPDIEQAIRRLRRIRDELVALRETVEGQWAALEDDPGALTTVGDYQRRLDLLAKDFEEVAAEFERRGIILRDLDAGLVDFPSVAGRSEIYLCWKLGEPTIGFWHSVTEGFAGRKPLSELPGRRLH